MRQTVFRTITLPPPGAPAARVVASAPVPLAVQAVVLPGLGPGIGAYIGGTGTDLSIPGQAVSQLSFLLLAGDAQEFVVRPGEPLFAVAANAGVPVRLALIAAETDFR